MTHTISSMTNVPISITIEGIEEVQKELDSLSDELRERVAYEMMLDVGDHVREWMIENIQRNFKKGTGKLEDSIFSTVLENEEGATLYVGPNMTAVPYAAIQNFGGNIYPGAKGYLMFEGDKGWRRIVTTRKDGKPGNPDHVVIQARPYIEPAFDDHQEEIFEIMRQHIEEAIAEEVATSGSFSLWRGVD